MRMETNEGGVLKRRGRDEIPRCFISLLPQLNLNLDSEKENETPFMY